MSAGRIALGGLLALALAGCAGPTPYRDDDVPKNLTVRTATDSGVRAALGVHRVDAQCRAGYLGTVALDEPAISLGLPEGRWTYLHFEFATSRFLGSARSTVGRGTLIKPRAGHRYEVDVRYRDEIYHVALREHPPRGKPREIPLRELAACD